MLTSANFMSKNNIYIHIVADEIIVTACISLIKACSDLFLYNIICVPNLLYLISIKKMSKPVNIHFIVCKRIH